MKKQNVVLSEIKEKFFVRVALNESHVQYLCDLKKSKAELPPIRLGVCAGSDELVLVDGRHRKAADERLGITEAVCEVRRYETEAEMIIDALKENVGGALPPAPEDITHTMRLLLAAGITKKDIIRRVSEMTSFPPALVAKHLDNVRRHEQKVRLTKAVRSIAEGGQTVASAAAEFGVDEAILKGALSGKVDDDEGATNVSQVKAWMEKKFKGLSYSNAQVYLKLSRDLNRGLLTLDEVTEVANHVGKLVDRVVKNHKRWLSRLNVHEVAEQAVERRSRKDRVGEDRLADRVLGRMGLKGGSQ